MAILIGGIVAAIVGAVWVAIWWCPFLEFLAGILPIVLILGGVIAIYFGVDELRFPAPQAPPSYEPKEPPPPEPAATEASAEPAAPEDEKGPGAAS